MGEAVLDEGPETAAVFESSPRRVRGLCAGTPLGTLTELGIGILLLGIAALAGVAFVHRPWPNRLDIWGDSLLPGNLNSHWAHDFVTLGSMPVFIASVIMVSFIGILRDWIRAIACATAPVLAVLIVQEIAKPLVDRHYSVTDGLTYPSGTVAAVAALATAVTLVMPRKARIPAAVLSSLAITGTAAAVVVLRWHYPTDALGGIAVGIGSVLTIDAALHGPRIIARMIRRSNAFNHPSDPEIRLTAASRSDIGVFRGTRRCNESIR
jgi:membrane-associated phospholipid phosphatase